MQQPQIRLHVFSDFICPFCYVGSARLLSLRDEFDLRVNWCHVEIHPEIPDAGMALTGLGYSQEQWQGMNGSLGRLAQEDGLELNPPSYIYRSQKALLLAEAAKRLGSDIYYPLHESIFQAYFRDGLDISDEELLRDLALQAGVDEDTIEDAWREQEYSDRLTYNLNLARQLGIHSTPTFVIGDSVLIGAQPIQRLREVMQQRVTDENLISNMMH